jgi:hypothetical protein
VPVGGWSNLGSDDDQGKFWLCAIFKNFWGHQYRCFASRVLHLTFDELVQRAHDRRWRADQLLQRAPGLGWKLDKLVLWMLSEGSWAFQNGQPMTEALENVMHSYREFPPNLAERVAALQEVMANEVIALADQATALREEAKAIVAEGASKPDGSPRRARSRSPHAPPFSQSNRREFSSFHRERAERLRFLIHCGPRICPLS